MKSPYRKYILQILAHALVALLLTSCSKRDSAITLHGASQFDENHSYTRTLRKFQDLVTDYYGKPIKFEIYGNSELGLEKDYFSYMSQGLSVDFAIVSPSHMSTFSKAAPIMDMPFLFRDSNHWKRVMEEDALEPIAQDVAEKADVLIVGYAGGGMRQLVANKPVTNMKELEGLNIRVMGAPIQTKIFQAITAAPTVIAYNEIYNAVQTGVIDAAENEASGIQQMKFYEVGPEIALTQHAITVRPICFSGKTYRRLPEDLQAAIARAGKEAGAYGRKIESDLDAETLSKMEAEGKLTTHVFTERDKLLELVEPVKRAYAAEVGALEVLEQINGLK